MPSPASKLEEPLKNYRFLLGQRRSDMDHFYDALTEPYKTYFCLRYIKGMTIERIAEEMKYTPRAVYKYRRKVLRWWSFFLLNNNIGSDMAAIR